MNREQIRKEAEKCFPNKSMFADSKLMWEIIGNIESIIVKAVNEKLDEAAKLVAESDEVVHLNSWKRNLLKKTFNNVNGLAYAEAIKSLKLKELPNGR